MASKWLVLNIGLTAIKITFSSAEDSLTDTSTCAYTFNVPSEGGPCLPGAQNGSEVRSLQETMTNQHIILKQQLDVITAKLEELSDRQSEDGNQQANQFPSRGYNIYPLGKNDLSRHGGTYL